VANISAIVPTIGRPDALAVLLDSLAAQTRRPDEVLVADGSSGDDIASMIATGRWAERGLIVRHQRVSPPNAVSQRVAAITRATGDYLLLLDDDVVLESPCVEALAAVLGEAPDVAAVMADMTNEAWPEATVVWRWYLKATGMREGEWHGRVVGPLLRFGYPPHPLSVSPMEWFGTANTLLRRAVYDAAGGFSTFFLHRSTMNEDVDLALKVGRHGRIVVCPDARLSHHHHPSGRVSVFAAAEDDLFNRYLILTKTTGRSALAAFGAVASFFLIETASNVVGAIRRRRFAGLFARTGGRASALFRICAGRAG
jgi:GT2 family glycosyltransferase